LTNSVHVVCGALVLTTSLVLALRTWRVRFAQQREEPQGTQSAQSAQRTLGFSSAVSASSAIKRGSARA